MFKKIMLLGAAIAAFVALAAPAAQGAPVVTDSEEGKAGSITATSENTVTLGLPGPVPLECSTVILNVGLSDNDTSGAHGSGDGEAKGTPGVNHSGHCILGGALPTHIEEVNVDTVSLDANGGGSADYSFTFTITHPSLGPIMCTNEGSAAITYPVGGSTLSISGTMEGVQNVPPCAAEATISGDFDVTDELGEPAQLGHN